MSNPGFHPSPENAWPVKALQDIAFLVAVSLDCSGVWIALRNRHHLIAPSLAMIVENSAPISVDAQSTPDVILKAIEKAVSARPTFGGGAYVLNDITDQPTYRLSSGQSAPAISSLAATRIVLENTVVGALVISHDQSGVFSERQEQALFSFARQAATAMRQAVTLENYHAQANVLRALLSASNAIVSTRDERDVFRGIIGSIEGVIAFERALIYRYDERAQALTVIAASGSGAETLHGAVIRLDDPLSKAAQAAREKQTSFETLTPQDVSGRHTDMLRAGYAVSMLCAPLISKGHLYGVASLAREQAFSRRDVDAMKAFSPIAAAALENAQLFRRAYLAARRQEAIFKSASDGIAVVNGALKLIQVNEAFARFLGDDPRQLENTVACHAFGAAQGPQNSANCLLCGKHGHCQLATALETRQDRANMESEFPVFSASESENGSYGPAPINRVVSFNVTYMPPQGGPAQLTLLGRDITAQREVENVRAHNVNMVTHEIARPLQAMGDTLAHLRTRYQSAFDATYAHLVQAGLGAYQSVKLLIDDLGVVALRDAGSWRVSLARGDLAEQARKAVEEQRFFAFDNGVTLTMEPPTQPLPQAMIDTERACQVARNLISNAIKYTPAGGHVHVSVYADARYVWLSVKDNGIGIPEDKQKLIWDRSTRVTEEIDGRHIPGQGQGLAIVRIIMDSHHGVKDVQSEPGRGSVFSVGFPLADTRRSR